MPRRDFLSLVLVGLAVGFSILALGGAPRWSQAIVALLASAALASQLGSRRVFQRWPPLLVLIGVAAAWTAIQLIPMPHGLLDGLTPVLQGLREDGAAVAGVDVSSAITMDAPATLRSLAFLLTLAAVAMVSLRIATSERGRYILVATVCGFAGAAAVISGVHKLFGITDLYGLYTPRQASPPILGPLLNSNHLGCLMAIGAVSSVGLLLYPKQTTLRRSIWSAVGGCCLVVLLVTLSRGAIIALAAGLFVAMATLIAQRIVPTERTSRSRRELFIGRTLPAGVVILCSLVVSVYVGAGSVVQQFESTTLDEISQPTSKFAAWRSSFTLIQETPWVGVGRGAFESTFTRVHAPSAFVTFSHVENEPIQAAVEWGVPLTIVLGALAVWLLLQAIRRWNDGPLAASAFGALMVIAFQSNFDFGAELLGIAVPITVLASTLTYVGLEASQRRHPVLGRVSRVLHLIALLAGAAVLMASLTRGLEEDHVALHDDPSVEAIESSIERHPLDYLGYAMLAQREIRAGDPNGIRLLNHALRLHPTHATLHAIAARMLVRAKRLGQAETEYAAMMRGLRNPEPAILETVAALTAERAAAAIPLELDLDATIRTLDRAHRRDVALLWLDRIWQTRDDLHVTEVLYSVAVDANDLVAAERAARRRCALIPTVQCRIALAKVLVKAHKPKEVIEELHAVAEWRGHKDDQIAAWFMLCDAQVAIGSSSDAKFCLRRLEGSSLLPAGDPELKRRFDALDQPVLPN